MDVLETERLVLRQFTEEDAAFILGLLNEPGWKRFIGDRGVDSLETARNYIQAVPVAAYHQHGFGLYAVELKEDRTPIGMCGLIKRDALEDVDIGFALLSRFEGCGYAQEAANATLAYARDKLGIHRVVAITTLDNDRSGRLLERIGMKFERTLSIPGDSEELRLFAIDL